MTSICRKNISAPTRSRCINPPDTVCDVINTISGISNVARILPSNQVLVESVTFGSGGDISGASVIAPGSVIAAGSVFGINLGGQTTTIPAGYVTPIPFEIPTNGSGLTLDQDTTLPAGTQFATGGTSPIEVVTATPIVLPLGTTYTFPDATSVPAGLTLPAAVDLTDIEVTLSNQYTVTQTITLRSGYNTGAGAVFPPGMAVPPYVTADPVTPNNNPLPVGTVLNPGFTVVFGGAYFAASPIVLPAVVVRNDISGVSTVPSGTIIPAGTPILLSNFKTVAGATPSPLVTSTQPVTLPSGTVVPPGTIFPAGFVFPQAVPISSPTSIDSAIVVQDQIPVIGTIHLAPGSVLAYNSVLAAGTLIPAYTKLPDLFTGPEAVFVAVKPVVRT